MKILVRGTNWVGDAVMTIPALRELRRIFPNAEITLYTRSWARGIFQDAEFLDEILVFDKTKSKVKDAFNQSIICAANPGQSSCKRADVLRLPHH